MVQAGRKVAAVVLLGDLAELPDSVLPYGQFCLARFAPYAPFKRQVSWDFSSGLNQCE
jgi:hypothetical protein